MNERVNQWIKIDKLKDEKVSNQYGNKAMIRKLYYVVESRQCSTGEEMEAAWSELKDGLVGTINRRRNVLYKRLLDTDSDEARRKHNAVKTEAKRVV